MNNVVPNHLSHSLELDYKNRKRFLVDRVKIKRLVPGIVFGFLLFLLGLYEWFNAFRYGGEEIVPVEDISVYKPLLSVWFFDLCFIFVGLGIVVTNILLYIRYNKYKINGKKVTIVKRPICREKIIIQEDLQNYKGVRFRVEFLQSGFLTQNRYVVELYHCNSEKIVPLYLSTNAKVVRYKWKSYAKLFKLPALINTDNGLKVIDLKNLNKSITEQYKLGFIEDTYDNYDALPSAIDFVRKKDKMVLKVRKVVWDAYNILAWMAISIIGFVVLLIMTNLDTFKQVFASALYSVSIVGIVLIAISIQILFRKEKLVI